MSDRDTTARWNKGAKGARRGRRLFDLPLREGDLIAGKYEVINVLGDGGMGAVYHARHVRFRREVAIKVLHPMLSRDELMVRRFEREAQAAGRIGSEHIVKVLDAGTFAGGERFLVMEYLDGESLADRLDRIGTLRPEQLYPILVQLLEGLAAAHDARFVHRDLKPSNVFLVSYEGRDDFVKILDFGVSKLNSVDAGDVTQTGVLLGTPHFMAPEQIRGARHVDHRSDLYAVGVIAFRALTGLTPFVGATAYELLHKIGREDAPPLKRFAPDVDDGFAALIDRALERDPDARFANARAFVAALRDWSNGSMRVAPLRTPGPSLPPLDAPPVRSSTPVASPLPRWPLVAVGAGIFLAGALAAVLVVERARATVLRADTALASAGISAATEVRRVEAPPPVPAPLRSVEEEPPPAAAPLVQPSAAPSAPPRARPATIPPPPRSVYAPEVGNISF